MSANNFLLTLDTIAPRGGIIDPAAQVEVKGSIQLTISYNSNADAKYNGAAYMKVWYDTTSSPSSVPADNVVPWTTLNTTPTLSFASNGYYYAHLVLLDNVGNQSQIYNSPMIVSDTQAPVIRELWAYDKTVPTGYEDLPGTATSYTAASTYTAGTDYFYINESSQYVPDYSITSQATFNASKTEHGTLYTRSGVEYPEYQNSHVYTNESTFGIHIKAYDTGTTQSGLKEVRITGNLVYPSSQTCVTIAGSSFNNTTNVYEGDLTFAGGATPGTQTITVTAEDYSGNTTTSTCTIIYDPNPSTGNFALYSVGTNDSLPAYLNYNSCHMTFKMVINATDATTAVKYYQLVGDIVDAGSPVAWPTSGGTPASSVTLSALHISSGDGTKSFGVKLIDAAGNITTLPTQTRVYDDTQPTGTLVASGVEDSNHNIWISAGTGMSLAASAVTQSTITYTAADATSGLYSGWPKFYIRDGGTDYEIPGVITSGTNTAAAGSFTFDMTHPSDVAAHIHTGANIIVMKLKDNSGNTREATCTVNIEATWTLGTPTLHGYLLCANEFNHTTKDLISATVVDNISGAFSERDSLQVWTNTTQNSTTTSASQITWTGNNQLVESESISKTFAEDSASNYLHVKAVSIVGNVAYAHIQFNVDKTGPTYSETYSAHVNNATTNITLSNGNDNLSGIYQIKIEPGTNTPIESGTCSWTAYEDKSYAITLGPRTQGGNPEDGNYSVIITVRDRAGNETQKIINWEYDNTIPGGALVLKKASQDVNKDDPSPESSFRAQITFYDSADSSDPHYDPTDDYGTIQYKLYGDFGTSIPTGQSAAASATAENDAQWVTMTANTMTIGPLYCTKNANDAPADGVEKKIYLKLKDDAGNVTQPIMVSFVYNPVTAELTIDHLSHNRISCVHARRKTGTSTISDATLPSEYASETGSEDYADKIWFRVTCPQTIQEWKVAAFVTYPSSQTTGAAITPMSTHGSGANISSSSGYHQTGTSVTEW